MTQLLSIQFHSRALTPDEAYIHKNSCLRMFKGAHNWKRPRSPSTKEINCGKWMPRNTIPWEGERKKMANTYNVDESQNITAGERSQTQTTPWARGWTKRPPSYITQICATSGGGTGGRENWEGTQGNFRVGILMKSGLQRYIHLSKHKGCYT